MRKRIVVFFIGWMVAFSVVATPELAIALKDTPAPDTEFIRTPAKYVFKKLINTAQRSGNTNLSSFDIKCDLSGCDDVKISINFAGMSLLEAIQQSAKATGAGVDFQDRIIVLKDPTLVEELILPDPDTQASTNVTQSADTDTAIDKKPQGTPSVSFSDVSHGIVFVENGESSGSAFIAEMNGKTYIFSNQHNFLGAKRIVMRSMTGQTLKPIRFEYSRTHDLVRLLLPPEATEGLKILTFSQETPNIDDKIVIYGNSAGGGVATELDGKIIGVGPSDIEITAKMVPGNSGSPILNGKAEVVGVATYATLGSNFERGSAYDKMYKGTRFSKVRRYGVRIPEDGWISDNLSSFLRQTHRQKDMKNYITAILTLQQYWTGSKAQDRAATDLFDYYGRLNNTGRPPFEFSNKETEEQLRKVVRSFVINHRDLLDHASRISATKREEEVNRMKKNLTSGVQEIADTINETFWKTNLLKSNARELKDAANEIINTIRETKDPYASTKKKSRRY